MLPWEEATAAELSAATAYHQLIQQQQESLLHQLHQTHSAASIGCKRSLHEETAADKDSDEDEASGDSIQAGGDKMMAALGRWAIADHATAKDASGEEPGRTMEHCGEAVRGLLLQRALTTLQPLRTAHHTQEQTEAYVHHSAHEMGRRRQRVEFMLQCLPDMWAIITTNAAEKLH
ncbi:hypothetical protein TraAM80_06260 [Trypanosoma rangeli]|uniref:Uncharacterized protein n=1 Tax=Trypanosoma rangeli TaxID=5698 RepID=A0A422NBD3_TRYRA|nr:uncharacterized protein TraAM80_06260 [Trypanosoma rangeli]RNF02746.1 hypothetical protein TraAM80_06260 [Trypanosoma rangeli]|eukprot:RNF02746.1 hypothetical protein TraAM80_06260 [Trypanosoma rangeli]